MIKIDIVCADCGGELNGRLTFGGGVSYVAKPCGACLVEALAAAADAVDRGAAGRQSHKAIDDSLYPLLGVVGWREYRKLIGLDGD